LSEHTAATFSPNCSADRHKEVHYVREKEDRFTVRRCVEIVDETGATTTDRLDVGDATSKTAASAMCAYS